MENGNLNPHFWIYPNSHILRHVKGKRYLYSTDERHECQAVILGQYTERPHANDIPNTTLVMKYTPPLPYLNYDISICPPYIRTPLGCQSMKVFRSCLGLQLLHFIVRDCKRILPALPCLEYPTPYLLYSLQSRLSLLLSCINFVLM